MRRIVRRTIWTLFITLWISQITAPTAQAFSDLDKQFIEDLERLQAGTLKPESAIMKCAYYTRRSGDEALMEQVMSGFLDVPQNQAISAFCTALAEAVTSQRLQLGKLRSVMINEDPDAAADGIGHLFRELYYAHERRSLISSQTRISP